MTAEAHVCLCFAKHTRLVIWMLSKLSSYEVYERLLKRKTKDRVPCLRQSQDQRMGRKHLDLAMNRQQTSLRATKVLSDEWLQKIEKRERKPDTSEKQSVEISASIRLEEAEEEQEDVGSWTVSYKPIKKKQLRVRKPSGLHRRRCPPAPDR